MIATRLACRSCGAELRATDKFCHEGAAPWVYGGRFRGCTTFLICPSHCVCPDGLLETFETDFAEILEREHFSFAEFSDDI